MPPKDKHRELENSVLQIIKASGTCCVPIFDRGDYYCVYGASATTLALNLFQTASVLKTAHVAADASDAESSGLPYITLSRGQLVRVVRHVLLRAQYALELYAVAHDRCQLTARGSAGNVAEFEDMLSSDECRQQQGVTAACSIRQAANKSMVVSLACLDMNSLELTLAEFADSAHLPNLQCCLVQLGVLEALVCGLQSEGSNPDHDPLQTALKRSAVMVHNGKKALFRAGDIVKDLERLLKPVAGVMQTVSAQSECVLGCAAALSSHAKLGADATNAGRLLLRPFVPDSHVRLDAAALDALEIFANDYFETKQFTLYSLLNKCRSSVGQRLLELWLRQPLTDIHKIEERLDCVSVLVEETAVRSALLDQQLSRVPDLQAHTHRLIRGTASLSHVHQLYSVVKLLPHMHALLLPVANDALHSLVLKPVQDCQSSLQKLVEMVESTVDLAHLTDAGELRVKPEFDENLLAIANQIDEYAKQAAQLLNKAAHDLRLEAGKSVKLETNAQSGFYFRVTKKDEKALRNTPYKLVDSQKGGVRFNSAQLSRLSDEYVKASQQYDVIQKDIIEHIMSIAAGYIEPLRHLSHTIASIDVLCALAAVAANAPVPYVRPVLLPKDEGTLELIGCRHPCIEAREQVAYIPNDVRLSKDGARMLLVTGPNMAGKSTYLRSAALSVLLAHVGAFVPCSSARISVRDAIFTRVGAADNQMKGVSTFMAEMLDCAHIVEAATAHSFVVVDELGRGTSTYDGFGLAYAIAERLAETTACQCLFATHFHELCSLASHCTHVTNVHVTAVVQDAQLCMMYSVQPGVAKQSFGIEVAKAVNFPPTVIEAASSKLDELTSSHAHSLAALKHLAATDPAALRARIKQL